MGLNKIFPKKICLALSCCAAALAVSGCADDSPVMMSYEKPLETLRYAAVYGDTQSYLDCWTPQEKARFTREEGYAPDFLAGVYDRANYKTRLYVEPKRAQELGAEEIEELENEAHERYGTHFDFSKAQKLKVEFRVEDDKDLLSEQRELIMVYSGGVWYIYGDVITELSFSRG